MRYVSASALCLTFLALCACSFFEARKDLPPAEKMKDVLVVPVGKNWEVKEEAPVLTNERHEQTLPFQREESIKPPGAQPVQPAEERKIETKH